MIDFLVQIGLLTGLTAILGYVFRFFRLPLLAAYIVTGMILGPILKVVDPNSSMINLMAELGLLLITFEIGAAVRLSFLRSAMVNVGMIAIIELLTVIFLAYLIGSLLGLEWLFILLLIMFAVNTSTSISFKLIEETNLRKKYSEREVKTLFGLATAEDIIAITGLGIFPLLITSQQINIMKILSDLFYILILFFALIGFGLIFAKRIFDAFSKYGEELALMASISLALITSWLGSSIGLSPVLGAFIGGLIFSETKISEQFMEKARWLREFFAFLFFASIGLKLPIEINVSLLIIGVITSLIIVFIKFFAFSFSIWIFEADLEKALRLGLYMLAISEFAVIIANQALNLGVIGPEILTISVTVVVMSSTMASLLTSKDELIASKLAMLMPFRLRSYLENYVFKFIAQALTRSGGVFSSIRESLTDLLLILIFYFSFSSFIIWVINIIISLKIAFQEIILLLIGGIFISSLIVIIFLLYRSLKKIFINISKLSHSSPLKLNIPISILTILISLFLILLTVFQIYFSYLRGIYNIITILEFNLFHISVIILMIFIVILSFRLIYHLFISFRRKIKGN